MSDAYKVEPDGGPKCTHCGSGQYWIVVGPDDVAISTSYGEKEHAEDMAEELSAAYRKGFEAGGPELLAALEGLNDPFYENAYGDIVCLWCGSEQESLSPRIQAHALDCPWLKRLEAVAKARGEA